MHVTSEDVQVVHPGQFAMPDLIGQLGVAIAGDAVVEDHSHTYGLAPVLVAEARVVKQAVGHGENHAVEALSCAVVFRHMRGCGLVLDAHS
jgi:hypothetical protein